LYQKPPHTEFLAFAQTLADHSRSMLLLAAADKPNVEVKQDGSFVTATDREIEASLRHLITETYPEHGILGEEFENQNTDAEFVWVLDPIDGTAPYIAGIPVYGSLIALAWKEKPFIGVIDHPRTSDRWIGVVNSFAELNGKKIQVRPCHSLSLAFSTCSNPDFMTEDEKKQFDKVRGRTQYMQYGGACFSYGVLASGRTDIAIDGGLKVFDIFAPAAVISGAGGVVTDWNGHGLNFDNDGTIIASGDKARHMEIIDLLQSN